MTASEKRGGKREICGRGMTASEKQGKKTENLRQGDDH